MEELYWDEIQPLNAGKNLWKNEVKNVKNVMKNVKKNVKKNMRENVQSLRLKCSNVWMMTLFLLMLVVSLLLT
mgnify:CR=1 FL=1